MAMVIFSISSHVKDKNSISTVRDEDMIFLGKRKNAGTTSVYIIKTIIKWVANENFIITRLAELNLQITVT